MTALSPVLASLQTYPFVRLDEAKAAARARGIELIDFGMGDPIEPTPEFIQRALVDALPLTAGYPRAPGLPELREAIARWLLRRFDVQVDPQRELIPTYGSKEAIFLFPLVACSPEKNVVVIPEPAYPVYERGAQFAGAEPQFVPLREDQGWLPDLDAIDDETWERCAIFWVNYPHNPTGAVAPLSFYEELAERARAHGFYLASDEAYSELWFDSAPASAVQLLDRRGVVVFQTLSKRSSMTGYRSGFVCAGADVIDGVAFVSSECGDGAAGVRPARVGRGLGRRGSRRGDAPALRVEARAARAGARPRAGLERGDVLPLVSRAGRRVVGGAGDAAARARRRRRTGLVLRAVRRGVWAARARAIGRRMCARGRDPARCPVSVEQTIAALDRGEIRVAEKQDGSWVVNEDAKAAILEYFRVREVEPQELGLFEYRDKIPLKHGYEELGVRVVPPATARFGAFLSRDVILMPSYVNIGAWVGPRTMVDTWATVGSCAQIGADVHLAGGVGIGGVLEPIGARPVIVEDGAFIGSRAVIVEGVIVGEQAVIAPQVVLSATVPIIDVTGPEPVEHRGYVPPRSVVVPGTRPKEFPAGTYQLACALIIGQRKESTDLRTSLNDALREFGVGTG